MQAAVKTSVREVADELAQLGLTPDILLEAILRGEVARDACTANDAPCAPGFYAWAGTVRALRDILMPQGWARNDDDNYSRVISPNKQIAIAFVTGNEGTGKITANPKTKYPKGPATQAAVTSNQRTLFSEPDSVRDDSAQLDDQAVESWITWMLLRKREGKSVFAELSLPSSMTKDGQVESWQTRIILSPIVIDPNIDLDEDSETPIDVPVRRRS